MFQEAWGPCPFSTTSPSRWSARHKKESEIRRIVIEQIEVVGLLRARRVSFQGEISGGMRKRAGLARALVLDPQIILCDEPDSELDPVRTAYLSQLLIDLNAQIDATMIVTRDLRHRRHRARQHGDALPARARHLRSARGAPHQRRAGRVPVPRRPTLRPIGMSEEKDAATLSPPRRSSTPAAPG
ncbi:ATP-binding cassette domain-containing protein OS=Streptomyces tendae OX=1932 GN=GUR47_10340 PE=4 SV=1 [Streptomyces tendae]